MNHRYLLIGQVIVFGVAFGLVEAAVVVYLRHLLGSALPQIDRRQILVLIPGVAFLEPKTAFGIIKDSVILQVERAREIATLLMLWMVAAIAGRKLGERLAFFLLAFGVWDIFYYVFLRLIIGWPKTLTDLDIFFLVPTPWVGPVFVPLLISTILLFSSFIYLVKLAKEK